MLELNFKAGAELFHIKLIPADAQFFADCLCFNQRESLFAHNMIL